MNTILVVDDEPTIQDVLRYALEKEGYGVVVASTGLEALAQTKACSIDLVILDVLMPDLDGLSVCKAIRRTSPVPIIFLSSRTEEIDRVLGLEAGGDDYIVKPFSPRELVLRVKAILRRSPEIVSSHGVTVLGSLTVDPRRHEVKVGATQVAFTATEFAILHTMLEHPGILFSRQQLIDRAYAHDNHVTERTIDTHVRRIRSKLKEHGIDPIETVHGLGYKATEPSA